MQHEFFLEHNLGMEQELDFSPRATKDNEWTQFPESQSHILEDRELILDEPLQVHKRILVGSSGLGKSTIAAHWARFYENDSTFRKKLKDKTGRDRKVMGVHISFSQALLQATEVEKGIAKTEAAEADRERASALITEGTEMLDSAFAGDPEFTVITFVDLVGITESDLGTSVVSHFAKSPRTRFIAPAPNGAIERQGMELRDYVREHENDESLDTWLRLERHVITGTRFKGHARELVESSGTRDAWERHWRDIYTQLTQKTNLLDPDRLSLEEFLANDDLRFRLYEDWLPQRLRELGVDTTDPDRFTFVPNPQVPDELHTHFNRMYERNRKRKHHFPLTLLGSDQEGRTLDADTILDAMGMKRRSQSTTIFPSQTP
jgi:hypothetical protein